MNRTLKVSLCLSLFVLLFVIVRNCIQHIEYVYISEQYPSFDVHARIYHSTKEIHSAVRLDNTLNPFYSWFNLTPEVESPALRMYGYGPVESDILKYRLRVFILCNQHAREVVTGELCYQLIRLLQLQVRDDVFTTELQEQSVNDIGYWIVPVGNPWGRQLVESNISHGCQRVNMNGIDLNRNYPIMHDEGQTFATEEEYPGEEPFSEYETQAVAMFADFVQPHLVLNVHSGGNDILLPYDGDDTQLPPRYSRLLQLASHARRGVCPECNIGSASIVYPPAYGTFIDYMTVAAGAPLAYTIEIFNDDSETSMPTSGKECRRFFNPDEGEELAYTLRKWTTIILRMVNKISTLIKS
jgi:hypothetical protein